MNSNLFARLISPVFAALVATTASAQLAWTQLQPATSPTARYGHSLALAQSSYDLVLFGGTDGSQVFGDTWVWSWPGTNPSGTWTLRTTSGPAPRYEHASARLDWTNDDVLLFGGEGASHTLLGDTWIWNGAAWNPVATPVAPSPRVGHAMARDEWNSRTVLLFGGRTAQGLSDETWRFSNGQWQLVPTPTRPPAREGHVLIQDAATEHYLLSGGNDGAQDLADEWEFDGFDWQLLDDGHIPARSGHGIVFESQWRRRFLSFGGLGVTGRPTVWERSTSGAWLAHPTVGAPTAREDSVLGVPFNFNSASYLLFGGRDASGTALGDTWLLEPLTLPSIDNLEGGCGPGPWGDDGPFLFLTGSPLLGSTVDISAYTRTPKTTVVLLRGTALGSGPFTTCGLHVQPLQRDYARTAALGTALGIASYQLEIEYELNLSGSTLALQAFAREPAAARGIAYSDTLLVTFSE